MCTPSVYSTSDDIARNTTYRHYFGVGWEQVSTGHMFCLVLRTFDIQGKFHGTLWTKLFTCTILKIFVNTSTCFPIYYSLLNESMNSFWYNGIQNFKTEHRPTITEHIGSRDGKKKKVTQHILNISISTLGVYMKRIYQELGTSENFKILSHFKNGQMFNYRYLL